MGYVYRPKLKKHPGEVEARESSVWWIQYYQDGRRVRENTHTDKKKAAEAVLKDREGRAVRGEPILPRRVRYDEIAADLRRHYETTGERNLVEADARLAHLHTFFGGRYVTAIGPALATDYALKRQGEGASNGTINRELAVLIRMLGHADENDKLARPPKKIHKLKEADPRKGFFEREQYEAVSRHLSNDLQVAVAIAHECGWRVQSEVLTLERRQLDLEAGTLRLDPGTTKNDDGREVYLSQDLRARLAEQLARVDALQKRLGQIIPYLFPHLGGTKKPGQRAGQRRRDFRKAWKTACRRAGCPGMLRHDFRRTAVRDMVNLGVPEKVAMTVTGHRTRSVFDRYHIVSPADLREAARKRDAARGHVFGHVGRGTMGARGVTSEEVRSRP